MIPSLTDPPAMSVWTVSDAPEPSSAIRLALSDEQLLALMAAVIQASGASPVSAVGEARHLLALVKEPPR